MYSGLISILLAPFECKRVFGEDGTLVGVTYDLGGPTERDVIIGIKLCITTMIEAESGSAVDVYDELGNLKESTPTSDKTTKREYIAGIKEREVVDKRVKRKRDVQGRMMERAVRVLAGRSEHEAIRICNNNMANKPFFIQLYQIASSQHKRALPHYLTEYYMCVAGVSACEGLRDIYLTYCKGLNSKIKANKIVQDIRRKCVLDRVHNMVIEVIGEEPLFPFDD